MEIKAFSLLPDFHWWWWWR